MKRSNVKKRLAEAVMDPLLDDFGEGYRDDSAENEEYSPVEDE